MQIFARLPWVPFRSKTNKEAGGSCSSPPKCGNHIICDAQQISNDAVCHQTETRQQSARSSLTFAHASCVSAGVIKAPPLREYSSRHRLTFRWSTRPHRDWWWWFNSERGREHRRVGVSSVCERERETHRVRQPGPCQAFLGSKSNLPQAQLSHLLKTNL